MIFIPQVQIQRLVESMPRCTVAVVLVTHCSPPSIKTLYVDFSFNLSSTLSVTIKTESWHTICMHVSVMGLLCFWHDPTWIDLQLLNNRKYNEAVTGSDEKQTC